MILGSIDTCNSALTYLTNRGKCKKYLTSIQGTPWYPRDMMKLRNVDRIQKWWDNQG